MATKSSTRQAADAAQETVDRIRQLNERIIENTLAAGRTYLDAYERALTSMVGYQQSLASATPVDWLQHVIETQAAFTREMGNLYAASAREMMSH